MKQDRARLVQRWRERVTGIKLSRILRGKSMNGVAESAIVMSVSQEF